MPAPAPVAASEAAVAQQSLMQAPNAVSGPSQPVAIAPKEPAVEVEAVTATALRRSGRKRPTNTTTGYAEDYVHPPPPAKKRKISGGQAAQPSSGPSTASTSGSVAKPRAAKHKRAPLRPRDDADALLVPDCPDVDCHAEGCDERLNASRRADNLAHLKTHYVEGALHSATAVKCLWCPERSKRVSGNTMVDHVAQKHLHVTYHCPYWNEEGVFCTETFKKPGYTNTHLLDVHDAPNRSS